MTNLNDALEDIDAIRRQIARGSEFRGYGPASIAASGVLALSIAAFQSHWLARVDHGMRIFLAIWAATASVSVVLTGIETVMRARRKHSGFATAMIHSAAEQFLPALTAGLLMTVVLIRCAPQDLWMLPGLWQVVFSLGIFASCRFLPRPMFMVGVWYLTAGLTCLATADGTVSPWSMGVPFGVGQLLVAAVLQFGYREAR